MPDDLALARDYASGDEDAFRVLVQAHCGMVRAVAARIAGETLADEITQAVFVRLAEKAGSLRDGTVVAGWLYGAARLTALEIVRAEKRRRARNDRFSMMREEQEPESLWAEIAPALDAAMARLAEPERSAIVLRFLEGRTFAEVAAGIGVSEGAAKMRVARALEKLRMYLVRHGVTATASALETSLGACGLGSAPPGFAAALTGAALNGASPTRILVKGGLKLMAVSKTKTAALAAVALILLSVGVISVVEAARPKPIVATFAPMAGEWEGKVELRGDDVPSGPARQTALRVQTSEDGRRCDIEMRIAGETAQDEQRFRFSHSVDENGRTITTTDDPQIGLLNGPGKVTLSATNSSTDWKAGFRAKSRAGVSECEWSVNGSELKIVRHDVLSTAAGKVNRYSSVDLRRKQD